MTRFAGRWRALVPLVMALLGAACSGGGNGGGGVPPAQDDLSGTCSAVLDGTRDGQPYQADASFDLVQSGDQVSGTWSTGDGRSGTVSGVIDGVVLTFTLTQTDPCDGTFTGQATVAAVNTVSGSYSGSSCLGDEAGDFVIGDCQPAAGP